MKINLQVDERDIKFHYFEDVNKENIFTANENLFVYKEGLAYDCFHL